MLSVNTLLGFTSQVFMGMGEPMLNLGNVSVACRLLNQVLGIGARFLNISTVGETIIGLPGLS